MGTTISIADSSGYLAETDIPGPGIVLVHDWFGVQPHIETMCDDLANAGYTVLAPDLYHGRKTTDPKVAEQWVSELDRNAAHELVIAAMEHLRGLGAEKVALMGFSIGAMYVIQVARDEQVDAVVAYYGVLLSEYYAGIDCPLLCHLAEIDEWSDEEPPDTFIGNLQQTLPDAVVRLYPGTEHSFANLHAREFDPIIATEAWSSTLDFLRAHLPPKGARDA